MYTDITQYYYEYIQICTWICTDTCWHTLRTLVTRNTWPRVVPTLYSAHATSHDTSSHTTTTRRGKYVPCRYTLYVHCNRWIVYKHCNMLKKRSSVCILVMHSSSTYFVLQVVYYSVMHSSSTYFVLQVVYYSTLQPLCTRHSVSADTTSKCVLQ
jgi:hypothetical protein